jgi:hypothetical protein
MRSAWRVRYDELCQASDVEHRRFAELAVVATAEDTVGRVLADEAKDAADRAYRRLPAAKGRITRAQKSGDAEAVAAAEQRYAELWAEWETLSNRAIRESSWVLGAQLDRVGAMIVQIGRTAEADGAVTELFAGGVG